MAMKIHHLRTERGAEKGSIRQCKCSNVDYPTKSQDRYSTKGYDGIINLNELNYLPFNSRPFNSITELSDLRMKPQHAVDRTRRLQKYFKRKSSLKPLTHNNTNLQ